MVDLTIRRARAPDSDQVKSIVSSAYSHYAPRLGRLPAPMTRDYSEIIANEDVWIVTNGSRLAGVMVLATKGDHILVTNLAIYPEFQGNGLGRRLLEYAADLARDLGILELRLYTHELMHENIAVYRHLGWREYDRKEQDGFPRVFMRKFLSLAGRHDNGSQETAVCIL